MPPKIPPKKPAIAQPKEQARVLFSYTAENDDELTIKEGDIINIIDKEIEDKGWMKGELNGKIGVFPDNFIALISPSVPASKPVSAGNNFKSVSNSFHSSNNSLNNGNSTDDSPPKLPLKKPNADTKLGKISSKFGDSIREMIISKSNNSLNETPIAGQKSAGPLFLQKQSPNSVDDPIKASPGHPVAAPAANSSAPSLPLKKSKLFATTPKPSFSKDEDSAGETTANENSLSKSADTSDLSSSMSSFVDDHSVKLTHLTKHRVQGPPRRPPSIIQINSKDDESFDGLDGGPLSDGGKTDSADNLDLDASLTPGQKSAAKVDTSLNRQSFKGSSPAGEMSTAISTTAKATTPTNQPPPWMVELKKTQAEKKNEVGKMKKNFSFDEGTADRSLLASASVAPSPVVGQSVAPASNSFNGTSPSSSKKALQMPNSPTKLGAATPSVGTSHRMSGDYSQRFKDFLQQNSTPATNSLSRHSSVNNHSFNSARTLSTDSLTNNDSKEPASMLGFGNLASPFASVVKPVKAAKPTTAPKFVSGSPTTTAGSSAGNLLSSNLGNDRHAHQTAAGKDGVSRKEFDELQKKVNDLTEVVETQKQTYKGLMKDLINDLAEEKKKVANLTIEVDRLRKLTTTV